MYKNILLPLDLNETDDHARAVEAALHLLDAETTLHILSVAPNLRMPLVGQFFPPDYESNLVNHMEEALEALVKTNIQPKTSNPIQQAVVQGVVYDEVLSYARDHDVDLIIINSHKPNIRDYLLGPNAARVVRHADCSVMVLRH